jgi:hypothetical protein
LAGTSLKGVASAKAIDVLMANANAAAPTAFNIVFVVIGLLENEGVYRSSVAGGAL